MPKTWDCPGLTRSLAEFASGISYAAIPPEVRQKAKESLLDWLGTTIGGCREKGLKLLLSVVLELGGERQATILGTGNRTNVLFAALVNGMASHMLDFDDTHMPILCHCSAAILPAVLSVAEHRRLSGKELLEAYITGFETQVRIGRAAGRSHYERGWHATSTLGTFGAAVGVSKLMGLDTSGIIRAIGLAATQASGLRQSFGTMCKPFHPGKASMNGALSALLAEKGVSTSVESLEGRVGFLNVLSDCPEPEAALANPPTGYSLLENSFKPYASCRMTHPVIDLARELGKDVTPREVQSIEIFMCPLCLDAAGIESPQTGLEAKFSVFHCAALAFVKGTASDSDFDDEQVKGPLIAEVRRKVVFRPVSGMKDGEARLVITTRDGGKREACVCAPRGDPANPMSFEELVEKFKGLSSPVLSKDKVNRTAAMVEGIEDVTDISELVRYCHA